MPTQRGKFDNSPILLVPYVWIGDFVRCHSVVKLIKGRTPERPIDVLSSTLCMPLLDYMPGVRKGIVFDIPRRRPAFGLNWQLSRILKAENYGKAIITSRKWKAALAPALAGIPERVGFAGEWRYGLLTDVRHGENGLPRMIDQCAVLALPPSEQRQADWPLPELVVPEKEIAEWRARNGLADEKRPIVSLCPGAVGPSKRWPEAKYAELAKRLAGEGVAVWVLGGPGEKEIARIISGGGKFARDLTGDDLRKAILALAAADAAVSNDSGLLHVAAAIRTPAVGLFGPTSPWHWAPLNPIAATIEAPWRDGDKDVRSRTTEDIPVDEVFAATRRALG
ncbi:MAG: lipopolysaccharide heptosyltransferase II [Xanthobacteraceae bacterium]